MRLRSEVHIPRSTLEVRKMAIARRFGRWMIFALAICVVFVIVLRIGVGIYLSTAAGKAMVASQIESRIGLPVEVQSVSLGLRNSSLSMRIFDPNVKTEKEEIFAVKSASADLSLLDLICGHINPKKVELQGVTLILRVDAAGKVLTPLPKVSEGTGENTASLPAINLGNGRISIQQEGRSEFSLQNLELTVLPEANGEVKLSGSINDPQWAKWTVSGNVNPTTKMGQLELATEDGPLTMDRLSSIPFVPLSIWEHVRPDGRGAINVTLMEGSDRKIHYSVAIHPSAANLALPDANVLLAKVTGLIQVAGAKLNLKGTTAELAGGTLSVNGGVDFAPEPTRADLKVTAHSLDIRQLPAEWGLPRDIEGKLQGKANLTLLFHSDGRVEPLGGGSGTIENAKIRDIPVSIALNLVSNGKQYRFESPETKLKATPKTETKSIRVDFKRPVQCAGQPSKKLPEQPKTGEAPSTLDATVKLRGVEISELLEKLNVKLGYKISGKISAEVAMSVPLSQAASQAAYQFTGKLSSPALQLEGLTIRDLAATVVYQDGKLTLTELKGKIDQPNQLQAQQGSFQGTAVVERNPPGMVKMSFSYEKIPLGEVFKAIPGWSITMNGLVAGKAEFSTPYAKLSDPTAWNALAELRSSELVIADRTTKDLQVEVEVNRGSVVLKKATVTIEGIPVSAGATIALNNQYAFSATMRTTGTEATDLRKLFPEVELPDVKGILDTESRVTGTASPFTFDASGRITASKLTLAKSTANQIEIKWQVTPEKLLIPELKATVFQGTITGSADIPFARDKGGKFHLVFEKVNAEAATDFVPDFPVKLAGQVTGKITGTIVPAKADQPRVGNMDVNLSAPTLTVQGIPAERLVGKASIKNGVFEYRLEGEVLGGSFEVKGSYPGEKSKAPAQAEKNKGGSFQLKGLQLSRLAPGLGIESLAPLRGRVDANFEFNDNLTAGSGRVTVTNLSWNQSSFGRELTGVLILQDGMFRLSELTGRFAGGEVRAMAQVQLKDTRRNFFSVSLTGADAKRLLSSVPDMAEKIDGPVTFVARGRLGREMRGSGLISLPRGSVAGVPVADLRIPFDWNMAPGRYGRFAVREASVNTGTGKMEAALTVDWGVGARVDGQVRFLNVPLRTIVPELGMSSLFGNGRITGRFDLSGANVRSVNDLSGSLYATFSQTSVKEIPLLQQVVPFLNASGLGQPFQSGDVHGTLSQGVFRVNRLALVNPGAQVFADGSISLSGRIDASVVAHTGTIGPQSRALQLFGLRLPAIGPISLTLIQDVSDFLSNRTIRLTISGTTQNPTVRVNAAALLTEEAVRFFLARYVLPSSAAEALGLGLESGSMGKR